LPAGRDERTAVFETECKDKAVLTFGKQVLKKRGRVFIPALSFFKFSDNPV